MRIRMLNRLKEHPLPHAQLLGVTTAPLRIALKEHAHPHAQPLT
jgi:hypothetical protein